MAKKSGQDTVTSGDVVNAEIDRAMANDLTAPLTIDALEETDFDKVWDSEKIVLVFDHQAPPTTVEAAEDQSDMRKFAQEQNISNLYGNNEGVCHQLMMGEGHVMPSQLVVGADSHTCTYGALGAFSTGIGSTDMAAVFSEGELWFRVPETMKITVENELPEMVMPKDLILKIAGDVGADGATYMSMELMGSGMEKISVSGRMSMCNMGIEMGAKTAIVPPDEKTEAYVSQRASEDYSLTYSDEDADYVDEFFYNAGEVEPMVACPHSVDNVSLISDIGDVDIQQAFLGSCTNGRLEDLSKAADIVEGREADEDVRFLVAPASQKIYRKALEQGIIEKLADSGATIQPPGCTTCWGGHLGILASGEKCVSSSNRNFKGRMGSPEAEIYLSSPATVAASALTGKITDPRDI